MVVALLALVFGAMVLVGDGPDVAMGSDDPTMTAEELARLEAATIPGENTVTKADETPVTLAAAQQTAPNPEIATAPVREASLGTATDAAVAAALAEVDATEPESADAGELTTVGVVLGRRVNVRSGPSTGDGVIGQVVQDQEVEVIGYEANGWAHILLDGQDGYMSGDFLQEIPQG